MLFLLLQVSITSLLSPHFDKVDSIDISTQEWEEKISLLHYLNESEFVVQTRSKAFIFNHEKNSNTHLSMSDFLPHSLNDITAVDVLTPDLIWIHGGKYSVCINKHAELLWVFTDKTFRLGRVSVIIDKSNFITMIPSHYLRSGFESAYIEKIDALGFNRINLYAIPYPAELMRRYSTFNKLNIINDSLVVFSSFLDHRISIINLNSKNSIAQSNFTSEFFIDPDLSIELNEQSTIYEDSKFAEINFHNRLKITNLLNIEDNIYVEYSKTVLENGIFSLYVFYVLYDYSANFVSASPQLLTLPSENNYNLNSSRIYLFHTSDGEFLYRVNRIGDQRFIEKWQKK